MGLPMIWPCYFTWLTLLWYYIVLKAPYPFLGISGFARGLPLIFTCWCPLVNKAAGISASSRLNGALRITNQLLMLGWRWMPASYTNNPAAFSLPAKLLQRSAGRRCNKQPLKFTSRFLWMLLVLSALVLDLGMNVLGPLLTEPTF